MVIRQFYIQPGIFMIMDIELREKIAGEITLSDSPAETIRKWREEFKISQHELSNFLHQSPSVISDYETGRRKFPSIASVRKIVDALITIDERRGGYIIKKYKSGVPSEALIDIKDYDRDVPLERAIKAINGTNVSHVSIDRDIRGYTIVDGVKAILAFSYYEYSRLCGWSSERAIFFTDVKFGRSPMIAIRVHPLKPAAVVYIQPDNVDELAIKLADIENIPLLVTDMSPETVAHVMGQLR